MSSPEQPEKGTEEWRPVYQEAGDVEGHLQEPDDADRDGRDDAPAEEDGEERGYL